MLRRPPQGSERHPGIRKERREKNRKKPDILGGIRVVVVLLLIAQALRVAFASPRMRLEKVELEGNTRFTVAQVTRLGQIGLGGNIFGVNLSRVADRLMQQPVIEEATLTRVLPNTLRVSIVERKPVLQAETKIGRFYADKSGIVYERVPKRHPKLPTIGMPLPELPPLGQKLRPDLVKAVQECWKQAEAEKLQILYLRVDATQELWLNIATFPTRQTAAGRLKVRLGRATDLKEKFRDIRQALLLWPNLAATATHLDVMCPGRPAYQSKPETPGEKGEKKPASQTMASRR